MKELKVKVQNVGARLKINGIGWVSVACLFTDDNVIFAKSEEELQRVVEDEFLKCMCNKEAESECWEKLGDGL